uniref:SAM domain-containing protein n=1 Tax=Photinus pyralis TaxID=7054 RepID=A0A1Y1M760_PHOPY
MTSASTSDSTEFIQVEQLRTTMYDTNDDNAMERFSTSDRYQPVEYVKKKRTKRERLETVVPAQLAQWVYIQQPPNITMSAPSLSKTNSTNLLINSVAPIKMSNLHTTKSVSHSASLAPSHQNVILAHPVTKTQHVYMKPVSMVPVTVTPVSVSKNSLAYVTMIKPGQQVGISTTNQKYVLQPLPKITSSRIPATVTTNCVQSKIAIMPFPLHNTTTVKKPSNNKHKVFNLKIADGQLQSEKQSGITVMCDNTTESRVDNNLSCTEPLNPDEGASKVESVEDKTYELSIVEDSNSTCDSNLTTNITDDKDKKSQTHKDPQPKFQKHGVSILKKNYNPEPKSENISNTTTPNSITTISDSNTKEITISTNACYTSDPPVILPEPKVLPQKSERRRKSSFNCRKDYDEVDLISSSFWNETPPVLPMEKTSLSNSKNFDNSEESMEFSSVKDETDINMNEEFDAKKILSWQDGIGTLPGSDIRFQINEFGLLEYLKNDDFNKLKDEKKVPKVKEKKNYLTDEMRCLGCGCYGLPSEFITPKFCSYDCKDSAEKIAREKELKRKRSLLKRAASDQNIKEMKLDKDESISEEDSTSNDCSQDKYSYPWTCTKKGFSWTKYLEHMKAKAAPVKFFKDAFPYNRNGFRPGMKLEGVDPQHPSHFCVLSVAEVSGYRMRLHFDGYSGNYDIWVNADSMDIFPAGWCEKHNHVLHPPPSYGADFSWTNYLKQTCRPLAPKHLFANRAGSTICPNGFRVGMKLEAVDKKDSSLVCVATVADMMDSRILVHFDSWDDIYDYWADPTSPYIHPVGWADQNGHSLTPPNDYPNPETFTWEKYLKEVKATPAPVRAFKQKQIPGFKKGMRLECVDKRVPQLVRVASVDEVKEHQIRISFDGWPDRYSYWVDSDSPDIHPVGWCQKTGHPIEPPLTPNDVYDFLECPTVGCRGQGHVMGAKFSTHSTTADCPYSDENLGREHVLPDRLSSPDRRPQAVVPVSREPKDTSKPKLGRPPKMPRLDSPIKTEWLPEDGNSVDLQQPLKRKEKVFDTKCDGKLPFTNGYDNEYTEQIWEKHSRYLKKYVKRSLDPRDWEEEDVVQFIASVPYFEKHSALFRQHKIDGEALLMLSQRDIVEILRIKLGPAIKLYCIIMLLRQNIIS